MPDSQNDLDFGRYHIQRLLGRGGMGEVYLARDTALERDVAIKFVSSQKLQDSAARARLLREAQAAAGLDHPCICPVHEAGVTEDGRAYIVMPFIDGTVLADIIPRGPMPPREALNICSQVADALATAHRHGIVHRDLKPGNIMMTTSGRPRLLDFGIAQTTLVPHIVAEAATVTSGPATSGGLVGTPAYMSPEQVQHRQVDGRSDLFALGVVLYECLTGARAFDGPTPYEAIANVLRVDPPPPSGRVPGLDGRHDALCARMMAKDPNDRFQSAEEVVGAIRVLLPDTGRITRTGTQPIPAPPPSNWIRSSLGSFIAIVLSFVVLGAWWWTRPAALPRPSPEAQRWYDRGTEALRQGTYQTARANLEEAIRVFPEYALAYTRLAEADMELDDERTAQARLVRLSALVPEESRLESDERLRVGAVRSMVLHDPAGAVRAYQELATEHAADPGVWVDLGRAQEAAGLRTDASASYESAIAHGKDYAAADPRLGTLEGVGAHLDRALAAFAEAQRLYSAASNEEGQTEVLLRRGVALVSAGRYKPARVDLERVTSGETRSAATRLRAKMALSNVVAAEGQLAESQRMAAEAVAEASSAGLYVTAAEGLVELAATLADRNLLDEAKAQADRAIQLATDHAAKRTLAWATLESAEIQRLQGKPQDALHAVDSVLPFLHDNRYGRLELFGRIIAVRAHGELGDVEGARAMSMQMLSVAESLHDENQQALAASDLAGFNTALGRYTEALALRERAEAAYRRLGDETSLPYTLANHADLLIRLGRSTDAGAVLSELEAGISKGLESYVGRARRAAFLRAFAAATRLRCDESLQLMTKMPVSAGAADSSSLLAPGITAFCQAERSRGGVVPPPISQDADRILAADGRCWLALAAIARGDSSGGAAVAATGLASLGDLPNDELRWRLEASAAASAHTPEEAAAHRIAASQALARVRSIFSTAATLYETRPDLVYLKRRAGLT